jgi:hypothetical protein
MSERFRAPVVWPKQWHMDPDDYEGSILTDTNSTLYDISGPGRTKDALLQRAGRRLEEAAVRYRERNSPILRPDSNLADLTPMISEHV